MSTTATPTHQPLVVRSREGERRILLGDIIITTVGTEQTAGRFSLIGNAGPRGPRPIPMHYHQFEHEMFMPIRGRMQQRFQGSLGALFDSGAVGFTKDGQIAVRDASKVPLNQRAEVNASVADENRDRSALYREVANANGHPEWEAQIRATFAKGWIERARSGWYYQDPSGAWKQK